MNELCMLREQFLVFIDSFQNYSPATIIGYRHTLTYFFRDDSLAELSELSRDRVESWLLCWRVEKKWTAHTYLTKLKHIHWFVKWLHSKGKIEIITQGIPKPRLEKRLPKSISKEEADYILAVISRMHWLNKFHESRSYTAIATLLYTWLRKGELLKLNISDVDMKHNTISIIQGKGKKDRLVPICSRLKVIFMNYFEERLVLNTQNQSLFVSCKKDGAMGVGSLHCLIKSLKKQTNIQFSAHSLRHTFATLMLEWWCDIYTLSKIMGHSEITTTTIYLSCSTKQMKKGIEMHPLN